MIRGKWQRRMTNLNYYISVVGGARASRKVEDLAFQAGREIAKAGHILVCGGLGGVMEAAAKGANEAGGLSLGILPYTDRSEANPYLTASIPTAMGHGRNFIIALAADALIAIDGELGTLSEVALGLKLNKPVICLGKSVLAGSQFEKQVVPASTAAEAVEIIEAIIKGGSKNQ